MPLCSACLVKGVTSASGKSRMALLGPCCREHWGLVPVPPLCGICASVKLRWPSVEQWSPGACRVGPGEFSGKDSMWGVMG